MILKKQTVWLLTMLSLVVVLSVYYITSPTNGTDPFALDEEKNVTEEQTAATDEAMNGEESAADNPAQEMVTSSITSDELFTALRLDMETERSRMIENLEAIVASADQSLESKNEAYDQMQELQVLSSKESIVETMIRTKDGFEDALVNAEGQQVRVIVKAKEASATAANDIMLLVQEEFGDKLVAVEFQPLQ